MFLSPDALQEESRLKALHSYQILDTLPEPEYDNLTQLAMEVGQVPIALIAFVDQNRQWFKSAVGINFKESSREQSFCSHVVNTGQKLILPDTKQDSRFIEHPLVVMEPKIRFYAGIPLINPDNHVLGTLCIMDRQPRNINKRQIKQLETISRLVINQLENRIKSQPEIGSTKPLQAHHNLCPSIDHIAAQQEILKLVIDHNPHLVFIVSEYGHYLFANESMAKFHNTTIDYILSKNIAELYDDSAYAEYLMMEHTKIINDHPDSYFTDERMPHHGQGEQWIQWHKKTISLPISNTLGVLGIGVNITKQKQDELKLNRVNFNLKNTIVHKTKRLKERESQLRHLFDHATDLICVINAEGKIISTNRAWQESLGYNGLEIQNLLIQQVLHPEDISSFQETIADLWQQTICANVMTKFISKRGEIITTEGNMSIHVVGGVPLSIRCIFRDITEQKLLEAKLIDAESTMRSIFESITELILIITLDGLKIHDIHVPSRHNHTHDPNYLEILNHTIDILLMDDLNDNLDSSLNTILNSSLNSDLNQDWQQAIQRVITSGVPEQLEYWITVDQNRLWFSAVISPVNSHTITWVSRNITDRKQAELILQQTNEELLRATRMKNDFLSSISHELRNPLNAILGMTEGLQEEIFGSINLEQSQAITIIENSSAHLLKLINDMLDVVKIESGKLELDIGASGVEYLCNTVLTSVTEEAQQKQIQIDMEIPSHVPDLLIDERCIRQVLLNLLHNAIKFTPEGGQVKLQVGEPYSRAHSDPLMTSWLKIAIIDNGIGIAPEYIPKLFQPFMQIDSALNRLHKGTGLGLSLVKRIVELHGGNVNCTSTLGQGSTFTIELPCLPTVNINPEQLISESN